MVGSSLKRSFIASIMVVQRSIILR